MMIMTARPFVSIIMVIGVQRERAGRALASVLAQHGLENAEVLLFDTAFDRCPPVPGSDHAAVTVHPVREAKSVNVIRAQAAEIARGEAVAYLEEHIFVVPGWLDAITRGFRAGHGGVGGEPGVLNPGRGISDAITLMNYGPFRPTPTPRTFHMLPGHNSAYRRDLLLSFGDLLPTLLASEVLLGWKIIEKGHTLLLDPAAKFLHLNEEALAMISVGYYHWNRSFGENRAKVYKWTWWRRILQGAATPLVPVVRYMKYLVYLLRNDRQSLPILFRYTGVFLYAEAAAAIGMAIGVLLGAGDAEAKFLDYELNSERRI